MINIIKQNVLILETSLGDVRCKIAISLANFSFARIILRNSFKRPFIIYTNMLTVPPFLEIKLGFTLK